MSSHVLVAQLPLCDICATHPAVKDKGILARFDAKTIHGPWANLCEPHWITQTSGRLGTGYGQVLYTADEDESTVRAMLIKFGAVAADSAEATDTWTTDELREQFDVEGFAAPFVVVRRKSDGTRGSLEFAHSPRIYFNWKADK